MHAQPTLNMGVASDSRESKKASGAARGGVPSRNSPSGSLIVSSLTDGRGNGIHMQTRDLCDDLWFGQDTA